MKKIYKTLIIFSFIFIINTLSFATEEIINSQAESLGIGSFLKEADKYTKDFEDEINTKELFNLALSGKLKTKGIAGIVLKALGSEITGSLRVIGAILVIIIIHSILNSVAEGLENKGVSQVIFYVQYILIATIIMSNFADIINMSKNTIQHLTGFMNTLIPVLITLMITTGNIASASFVQPLLLFIMSFIANIMEVIVLPILLVATALTIISNLSGRIQIDKLSKYFKKSIIWLVCLMLTVFVRSVITRRNIK